MTTFARNVKYYAVWLIFALFRLPMAWAAPIGSYQQGTVVRMRMGDCQARHGFMANFGNPAVPAASESCPEYTLVSEKVVFVIVGKSSDQLVPLADVIDFRLHNKELVVRVDDARHETRFSIKEMVLRAQWDLVQKHINDELSNASAAPEAGFAMVNAH
jgi:hypothetical protein